MMPFQSIVGEICSSGDELTAKVRKPYTITKQRERWTEEEHLKFLEALKLYGRAWRRIEEHIGTKTAVQIRSHAQKFFSKLVRGSSGRGVSSTEKSHDIEIPPPRPKRKPRHPYPRKAGGTQATAKEGSTSPSAVSSATTLTLRDKPSEHAGFAPYDARRTLNGYETKMELPQRKGSPLSLKLFGQTMMVTGAERPTISASKPSVSGHSQGDFHEFVSAKEEITSVKIKSEDKALENGGEGLHALGLGLHTKQATNSAVHSESLIDSATPSEQKTNMLLCDTLSSAARDSRGKQDSEIQASSGQGSNSSSLSSDQELPGTLPGCPRHTAMQCVVDGMSRENGHEAVKNWLGIAPSGYPTSAMGVASDSALVPQLPPMFPWIQIQQGNTTAADAVAAATVAAASAWLSLCGAVPSFLHPGFFGTATPAANDLSACKAESMMGAMEQEGSIMVEREGEVMLQGSHSEKCTCNVMKEFDDSQDHGENISCQTEEQDQVVEDTELSNERSSSCSNNRLNNDQEFDPHSGTNIEENREVCQQGFQLYGGRCASEEEDSSKEEEDAASNNGGGQCTEVQREGQYACRTFSQEFLPHSFSMPSSVGGGLSLDMNNKDSFPEDGKHDTSRIGGGKMRPDLRGSICCEGKPYAGERNEQTPPKSPCAYREKKLEDSKPIMGHQLLEEPVAKFCKSNKFIASSIGKSQSGAGFVPYQRCSIQASKNRLHSRSADSSDVEREEKRICSKQ